MSKIICQVEKKLDLLLSNLVIPLPTDIAITDVRICELGFGKEIIVSGEIENVSLIPYSDFEFLLLKKDGTIPSNYKVKKWLTFEESCETDRSPIILYHLYEVLSRPPHAHELMRQMRSTQS